MTKNTRIVLGVVVVATLLFGGIYFYKQNNKTPSEKKTDEIVKKAEKAIESFKDVECESYWMGLSSDGWTIKCHKPGTIENKWVSINATTGEKIKEWTGE